MANSKWQYAFSCFYTKVETCVITYLLVHFQYFISNSLYSLWYNSYDVSSENLVSDQLVIPKWYFSLYSSLVCLMLYWYGIRNSVWVTHGSLRVNSEKRFVAIFIHQIWTAKSAEKVNLFWQFSSAVCIMVNSLM